MLYILFALVGTSMAQPCWKDVDCTGPSSAAFPGPWESNMFSPSLRTVQPKSVLTLLGGEALEYGSNLNLNNTTPALVFDFGIEVGGLVSVDYAATGPPTQLGLAFSEARDHIGMESDSSRGGKGVDGAIFANVSGNQTYTMPLAKLRGGFRYLTLFLDSPDSDSAVTLKNIIVEISFQPTWSNLRAYQGYFDSSDKLLNKIWYAGAWTLQSNSIAGNSGMRTPRGDGWDNIEKISDGYTVLVDGAKRDRLIWNGDMGTAVPSAFVSTGDLESAKNAITVIFENQAADGQFPKAGPPNAILKSDTYHLWHLVGTYNYLLYSGDEEFVANYWPRFAKGLNRTLSLLSSSGIVNVTGDQDWGRFTYDTERASASMLLYRALTGGADIATWLPESAQSAQWAPFYLEQAEKLKEAIMTQLWDEEVGAFRDSPASSLHPQDANSLALAYGIVDPDSKKAQQISDYLVSNWTPIGPSCPELPGNVSPFISSIELDGHFRAGRPDRALQLIRDLWGWYLNHENGTQSTTVEGFTTNGTWLYRRERGYTKGSPYLSHSHGWSTGPTSTLTEHMLGLRVTKPAGEEWLLQPASFTELDSFQGGFVTTRGRFSAKVRVGKKYVRVEWNTPKGTRGLIALPGHESFWVSGGRGKKNFTR
ncbi:Six-hairpin glycosidase-like protein [Aspergillus pseudoustus]|uniref:Six-hairpin glycosidase-like protein n=1 Tax=Aspergillus pseudoustus TaxID=1810923 RepID=A0ABR4J0X0_9EURO